MPTPLDLLKTPQQNLLDLINTTNTSAVELASIEFGVPADDTGATWNTRVTVSAKAGSRLKGSFDFLYRRLAVADHATDPVEYVTTPGETLAQVKTALCTQLGLRESDVEFDVAELPPETDPTLVDGAMTANLRAITDSLIYTGQVSVKIQVDTRTPLTDIFTISELDGFDLPPAP